ncbi:MAG: F0F1 ATP synthase subunit A [Chitinophagaceae bacterium]|nr:F0F1 ATP synthase subunit A [Chitinophagaceae bacterium]
MTKKILLILFILLLCTSINTFAITAKDTTDNTFNPGDLIFHHILDSHIIHIWEGEYGTLYLPVILYSDDRGIEIFSSSHFYSNHKPTEEYKGYVLEHEHIYSREEGRKIIDFSFTKNVFFLFLNVIILFTILLTVAKAYNKRSIQAPKGLQALIEPIIVFIRDEVVKPNIGNKYEKYLPYMLTLFFFIWGGNILGLFPGAGNFTGNIAVTLSLALITFIMTNLSGNKSYWGHIFLAPGVPFLIKIFIVPVEIIGIFTKPISLMIRLFVAITAGHIVMLSLFSLIFIFESYTVGFGATLVLIFINCIEFLVATLQAYVFTLFSSLYIGLATQEPEHH